MKPPIRIDRNLMRQATPDIPPEFDAQMTQMIDRLSAERKQPMRKKISVALVIALVVMALAAGAVAATLLNLFDLVEQEVVPLAKQNDETVKVNEQFTPEELAHIVQVAEENGITLGENSSIRKALEKGESYWEEETIMELCKQAWGFYPSRWTIAQQHWWGETMVAIGFVDENSNLLPGEGDLTEEEAQQAAMAALRAQYGQELPLDDTSIYAVSRSFGPEWLDDGSYGEPYFAFTFEPVDLWHGTYAVELTRTGEVKDSRAYDNAISPDHYTVEEIYRRVTSVYSRTGGADGMPQEAWQLFGETIQGAEPAETPMEKAFQASRYPALREGDLTRDAAAQAALNAVDSTDKELFCLVYLGDGDKTVWKATVYPDSDMPGSLRSKDYAMLEMDAKTGEILREGTFNTTDDERYRMYLLDSVYATYFPREGLLREEAINKAVALVNEGRAEPLPLLDEACYTVRPWKYRDRWEITFQPADLRYANVQVEMSLSGEKQTIEVEEISADTVFSRYRSVYGPYNDWSMATWHAFGEDMRAAGEATTDLALLAKQVHYPAEIQPGDISRREAEDIAIAYQGLTAGGAQCMVYIESTPHNLWNVWMTDDYPTMVYTIDAKTGEVVAATPFRSQDSDPSYYVFIPKTLFAPDRPAIEERGRE